MGRASGAAALAVALLLGGCVVGPDYVPPSVEAPPAFKEAKPGRGWKPASPRDEAPRGDWWSRLRDPALDRLIRLVDVDNQTLRGTVAAYRQARALVQESRASLFPTVVGTSGIQRLKSSGIIRTQATLEGNASWELDLWGRIRRRIEADVAGAQATAAELGAVRLSVQAELASNYYLLRYQDSLQRLLDDTVRAYERSLKITQNQYEAGVAARSDVITAQTQLETARAQAIAVGLPRATYEHAIALLVGRPPSAVSLPRMPLPASPPTVPVSVPSTLLERRPDVAQAERTVAQQSELIGVAVAAFFPTVTLSALGGYSGDPARGIFSAVNQLWSVAANASQPVFDGGARSAALNAQRAAYDAAVASYRQSVLTAISEVENDLSGVRILARQAAAQALAVASARRAVEIALNEYRAGTQAYTTVVTAQALELNNEVTALQVLASRFTTAIDLIRALGGGWDASSLPEGGELKGFEPVPIDAGQAVRLAE